MFMKNKNQQPQLDLFTPLYEIFHELCVLIFDLGKEVFKFSYRKIFNKALPIEKINRKALSVSKTTEIEEDENNGLEDHIFNGGMRIG